MKSDEELDGVLGISGARAEAEGDLLKLVREQDGNAFDLTITCSDRKWTVTLHSLNTGASWTGQGETFTEAWHAAEPQLED